ncbi:GTPase-activating protein [Ascosphaera pollenicola]|nr:GTPase-activating protein [Ascosphaera pollenicola]
MFSPIAKPSLTQSLPPSSLSYDFRNSSSSKYSDRPSAARKPASPFRTSSYSAEPSPRHPYSSFLTSQDDPLSQDSIEDDEDDIAYDDDDEDEFGLPTIKTIQRKAAQRQRLSSPFSSASSSLYGSARRTTTATTASTSAITKPPLTPSRLRTNSADIAEERGLASYPSAARNNGKILRPQYKEILRDPANVLNLIDYSNPSPDLTPKQIEAHSTKLSRINKFKKILQASVVSLPELRDLAWSGIPPEVRAMTWKLLLGYLPANSERRVSTLERKRNEYLDGVRRAFNRGSGTHSAGGTEYCPIPSNPSSSNNSARGLDEAIWHQISIDIPRTNPHIPLYGHEATQRALERILYVWAIRHPASGYVQGINDLVTPFYQVFLGTYITDRNIEEGMDPGQLPKAVLDAVEADSFWCLTKLLDGIQDNYIYAQPGIHRQVNALHDLTMRIDSSLVKHLEEEGVEFMQFSFRWMNCLLMREISIQNIIRMWDTYMAEEDGFSRFHLYVCAAFLVKWSHKLLKLDFQEIMMFLQALPTRGWTEKDIELLLSEAFIWQSLFQDASAHLRGS